MSSEDFHRFLSIFIDFHRSSSIFKDFQRFSEIFMDFGRGFLRTWRGLESGPAAPIETFARFQAGFLSSDDFHCVLLIFIGFHRFSWILLDFHVFRGMGV